VTAQEALRTAHAFDKANDVGMLGRGQSPDLGGSAK